MGGGVLFSVRADLEAQRKVVYPRSKSSNLAVRQNARVIGVDLIKHICDVELLLSAHEEIKVGESKLHVLRVANTVG